MLRLKKLHRLRHYVVVAGTSVWSPWQVFICLVYTSSFCWYICLDSSDCTCILVFFAIHVGVVSYIYRVFYGYYCNSCSNTFYQKLPHPHGQWRYLGIRAIKNNPQGNRTCYSLTYRALAWHNFFVNVIQHTVSKYPTMISLSLETTFTVCDNLYRIAICRTQVP